MSNDNPYSEAAFRTLKYTPAYPTKPFADIDEARQWVAHFVGWYNTEHRHSGIRFVTPKQRHEGRDKALLAARTATYEVAKERTPGRWNGRHTRNWTPMGTVWLNPGDPSESLPETMPIAA